MKEIKFLLIWLWGAGLTTSWFLPWITDIRQFLILPLIGSLVTAILGLVYTIENWNK